MLKIENLCQNELLGCLPQDVKICPFHTLVNWYTIELLFAVQHKCREHRQIKMVNL